MNTKTMPETDLYKILGVSKSASQDEIKKAYRKLSRKHHPDMNPDNPSAEAKFKEIQNAFDILGDEAKRKQFDTFGTTMPGGGAGGSPFPWGGGGGGAGPIDLGNIFGGQIDLESLFGGGKPGKGASNRGRKGRAGQDVEMEIQIPFRVAVEGGSHELSYEIDGRRERKTVKIPVNVDQGTVVRIGGEGLPGTAGGPPGDILLKINVATDPVFRRDGQNLLLDLPLTIAEAVLGAKVDVPTLDGGQVSLTIPPGTSSGMKLRLRGKGIPDRHSGARGDQFAVIKIVVPKILDAAAEKAIREFDENTKLNPRKGLW
ncbi:MAG: cbpA [Planctomycetaceae bacterium]|nr:cbpA [Planctomycetaceae bacterium]